MTAHKKGREFSRPMKKKSVGKVLLKPSSRNRSRRCPSRRSSRAEE